jgi:hypothetical protein
VKLQKDLREFIGLLSSHAVEYLIVGGHAVAFHGYPRLTVDLDFFVRPSPENAARLLAVLDDFGFGALGISAGDLIASNKIIQLGREPNRIDLLTGISGVSFEDAWADRVEGALDGLTVPFIGMESLLKNKRASGRPQDLADAQHLERRNKKS